MRNMMEWKCKACGAFDTRACNGDNEVCTECGTPDSQIELEPIWNEIARLYDSICDIGKGDPTTIVLNNSAFADYYYFCEHNDLDWTKWEGNQVILDRNAPVRVAVTYSEPVETKEEE